MTFPNNPIFGETTALRVSMKDNDGDPFTISAGVVTIKDAAGTALRTEAECTIDNTLKRVYYVDTFTAANGYVAGSIYTATFKITTADGYAEKLGATFVLQATNA